MVAPPGPEEVEATRAVNVSVSVGVDVTVMVEVLVWSLVSIYFLSCSLGSAVLSMYTYSATMLRFAFVLAD